MKSMKWPANILSTSPFFIAGRPWATTIELDDELSVGEVIGPLLDAVVDDPKPRLASVAVFGSLPKLALVIKKLLDIAVYTPYARE